jgi:hypothetical protein
MSEPVATSETMPAVAEPTVVPVVEIKSGEEAPVTEAPAETTAEETSAPAEEAKAEVKPMEDGVLEHKGAPANFPKYDERHLEAGHIC